MADISDILPDVLPDLPGAEHDFVSRQALHAIREFCNVTLFYRVELDAIDIVVDDQDYTLPATSNYEVITATSVYYDGAKINPIPEEEMDDKSTFWRTSGSRHNYYLNAAATEILLTFKPTEAVTDGLVVIVALRPDLSSTVYPDSIEAEYLEGICHGIKSRMMSMIKKPWSNKKMARVHNRKWRNCMAGARFRAEKSNTRRNYSVNPRPLA